MKINQERLATEFISLCEIDSPSRCEGKVAKRLKEIFTALGCDELLEDDSAKCTGAECGNLIMRFKGSLAREPLFFSCHMDTVEPATGVRVSYENGIFRSVGETILGSDDKSGIVALIEAMRVIREQGLAFGPVEFIFTTCEEIGLLGAKALDPTQIRATMGYALDSSGAGRVVVGAPAANRLDITIRGVAAHAGLHPEWGVNAILLAARALTMLPAGRVDEKSSVNIGTIHGGTATNIVPEEVVMHGEIRSHCPATLARLTSEIREAFHETILSWHDPSGQARGVPDLVFEAHADFPGLKLAAEEEVVLRIKQAAASLNMELDYCIAGGGSDANIFNGYGLRTAIVATGMTHVHSTDEQVALHDMVELTKLIIALLT